MKLYYTPGACSLSVHIALNEMAIPASFESVDLKTKKTETGADFLKINPKGEVSTLLLDNGQILTENAVILQYLADTYKKTDFLPPLGDFNRYRTLEWINFITTDIHKGIGLMFNPDLPADFRDKSQIPGIKKKFDLVDQHLATHKFIMGDHFTLPDAYLFVMLLWLGNFKIELSNWKNIPDYFARIKARPAVQKTLHEEGLDK